MRNDEFQVEFLYLFNSQHLIYSSFLISHSSLYKVLTFIELLKFSIFLPDSENHTIL